MNDTAKATVSSVSEAFSELHTRISECKLKLTQTQMASLLEFHEAFYCIEDFDWNPDANAHPLCGKIHHAMTANPNS